MQDLKVVLQSLIEHKEELENQRQKYFNDIANNIKMQDLLDEQINMIKNELSIYSTYD